MSIERFLTKHPRSTLTRTCRMDGDLIATVDAAINQVQVVDFDVASAEIVRVLVLLLSHDVGADIIERAV